MTPAPSVPYPAFVSEKPVDATKNRGGLPAVGKCRIYPEIDSSNYRLVVAKNVEQARVEGDPAEQKKLKKKYMKEGVAMAKKFLIESLSLDVSVIDVEVVVDSQDLLDTDGCLAACLLDAGCQAIVADGTQLEAMDAAKIPRDRLVAHFKYDNLKKGGGDINGNIAEAFDSAISLASVVSVEVTNATDSNLETILSIFKASSTCEDLGCVVQFSPPEDENALEAMMKEIHEKAPHGRIALVDPSARQLGLSYAAYIKTDRDDKLYTTVVATRNGEALGLVYSSKVCCLSCF